MATVFSLPDEILLKVFSCLDVTDVALSIANVCTHWKALACDSLLWNSLEFTVDKDMELGYILNVLPRLPQLRHVTLQWRTDSPVIVNVLCEHCPCLVEVKFICCGFIDRACVRRLFERYVNLKTFSLGKSWAVPSQCLDDIALLTHLTSLNLSNSLLTPEQFLSISHSCTKLTTINIDYVRGISEDILRQFISQRQGVLEYLSVFGELLTDNIFQNIQICPKLKLLHISTCWRFSDACLESISKLKYLRSLTLRKSKNLSSNALWRFYLSDTVKNLSHLYISAKRNINGEDISLWLENCSNVESCLVNQYCTCILTRDGFKVEKALE